MEMIKVRPRSAWVLEVGLVLVLPLLPPVMQWMVEIKRERAGGREVGAKERNREREKEREKERAKEREREREREREPGDTEGGGGAGGAAVLIASR